ncbi:MAG: UDP-N-acetylmuramate dehydrogenase [Candidatus Omnitrophica bacterium]|nr:UDP-N-acetylmuramate dehydrogenase [Candidatus Omnitrophota bacterium]
MTDLEMDIDVKYNEPMNLHTTFGIGGPADIFIQPRSVDEIVKCLRICSERGITFFILGNGSNLLVRDEGFRGMVIDMSTPHLKSISVKGDIIRSSSSVYLSELLKISTEHGLSGLEFLAGIPATLGGAIRTNASARDYMDPDTWYDMTSLVNAVKLIDANGNIISLTSNEIGSSGGCLDLKGRVILEAELILRKADKEGVERRMGCFYRRKQKTQESVRPNAGCIFKNPAKGKSSAGQLIDACGLKGTRIGAAAVSEKHANFIINTGGATSRDVLNLMDLIRRSVLEKFGVMLETEIEIV